MNYYFQISDADAVKAIDESLSLINKFDKKLGLLKEKYKSDKEMIFNSLDRGISFSCLAFYSYPFHLDTKKYFKMSRDRFDEYWESRPRKTNKKFYKEFMESLEDCSYDKFKNVVFNEEPRDRRLSIKYTKIGNSYYISSNVMIALPHRELTATQYKLHVS